MKDALFSICIPVRNDLDNLKQCLRGLGGQDLSDCEILICDDGSVPPVSFRDLEDIGIKFTLIRQDGRGPSAARNCVARIAQGTFLFFIDADTVPDAHMIECGRKIISTYQPDAFYGSYDDEPACRTVVSSYKNLLHHHTHHFSAKVNEKVTTFWCGCGVIRRELYLDVGGLSEFYDRPSIEDIELGSRLTARGICIRIFPQLQVKHLKKWTFKSWVHADLFRRGIPWVRLMRARRTWTGQLNFSWAQRIAALAACGMLACFPLALLTSHGTAAAILFAFALLTFLIVNAGFIRLVRQKRGLLLSIAVMPLHVIYSVSCVLSLAAAFFYPPLQLPRCVPMKPKEINASRE